MSRMPKTRTTKTKTTTSLPTSVMAATTLASAISKSSSTVGNKQLGRSMSLGSTINDNNNNNNNNTRKKRRIIVIEEDEDGDDEVEIISIKRSYTSTMSNNQEFTTNRENTKKAESKQDEKENNFSLKTFSNSISKDRTMELQKPNGPARSHSATVAELISSSSSSSSSSLIPLSVASPVQQLTNRKKGKEAEGEEFVAPPTPTFFLREEEEEKSEVVQPMELEPLSLLTRKEKVFFGYKRWSGQTQILSPEVKNKAIDASISVELQPVNTQSSGKKTKTRTNPGKELQFVLSGTDVVVLRGTEMSTFFLPFFELENTQKMAEFEYQLTRQEETHIHIKVWLLPSAFLEKPHALSCKGGHPNLECLIQTFKEPSSSSSSSRSKNKTSLDLLPLYESVLPSSFSQTARQPKGLTCTLRGYQRRALAWMLKKEKMEDTTPSSLSSSSSSSSCRPSLHYMWEELTLPLGPSSSSSPSTRYNIFVNTMTGALSRRFISEQEEEKIPGGILAEEMGLGKTVEVIACILSNVFSEDKVAAEEVSKGMTPIKGTLIISPETIVRQWESEIARHAPGLKVFKYEGMKEDQRLEKEAAKAAASRKKLKETGRGKGKNPTPSQKEKDEEKDVGPTTQDWSKFDVVLTTYEALRSEIHYAHEFRSLRKEKKYAPKKTPLLSHYWWRVALDEAQMIETPTANAAKMALKLETKHRWCVTGTPIGRGLEDLFGLALFLRTDPFDSKSYWTKGLEHPYFRGQPGPLVGFLRKHMWRNSKDAVAGELDLPPQKTEVFGLDFSPIERAYYQRILLDCRSRVRGLSGVRGEKMLDIILRLRQTCVHPQIGGQNSNTLGKELLSMDEVLSKMINDRIEQITALAREHVHQSTVAAVIFMLLRNYEKAEELCLKALDYGQEGLSFLKKCREQHDAVNPSSLPPVRKDIREESVKGKEPEESPSSSSSSSTSRKRKLGEGFEAVEEEDLAEFLVDDEEEEQEEPEEEPAHEKKRRQDERHYTERILAAKYNLAQCWIQMGKNKKEADDLLQEVEDYRKRIAAKREEKIEKAEIRKSKVTKRIDGLKYTLEEQVDDSRELSELIAEKDKAIRKVLPWSAHDEFERLMEDLEDACGDVSSFADELQSTRPLALRLLEARISLKEAATESGLESFRHSLRKSNQAIEEHSASLTHFERAVRQLNQVVKEFNGWLKKRDVSKDLLEAMNNLAELKMNCRRLTGLVVLWKREETSMRSLWEGLRDLRNRYASLQDLLESSSSFKHKRVFKLNLTEEGEDEEDFGALEKEGGEEEPDLVSIKKCFVQAREASETTKTSCEAEKGRLKHLLNLMEAVSAKEKECPVCLDTVSHSVMTPCAHFFCNDCIRGCLKQNPICPVCRAPLEAGQLVVVASKSVIEGNSSSSNGKEAEEDEEEEDSKRLKDLPESIATIQVKGSFGTKIDSLVKYLLFLQKTKPKEKSLVFSQWKDSLNVIAYALSTNNINFVNFSGVAEGKKKKMKKQEVVKVFQENDDVRVILLHAKTDSAGLTLVRATHVFLMEPLLNPAIELQAVARVHRMGQLKETHVHKFIVRNTIEEKIREARRNGRLKRTNTPENAARLKKEEEETLTKEELEYFLDV